MSGRARLRIGVWWVALATLALTDGGAGARSSSAEGPVLRFRDVAVEVGVRFHHFTGATGDLLLPEIMGPGVAVFDYDGDGDLDILVMQGDLLDPSKTMSRARFSPPAGWTPGPRLFRNELVPSGSLRFTDVTEQSKIRFPGHGMGVAVGDYDNDGRPDLLLTGVGHVALLRNNGDGTFSDVSRQAGIEDSRWSVSAAFVDYDRDGLLDIVIVHYVSFSVRNNPSCRGFAGERDYCGPQNFRPVPSRLYRNLGNGQFADVTRQAGLETAYGAGLGVGVGDFDGDGWLDLYIANDRNPNHLWMNRRDGRFEDTALLAGAALSADGRAKAGMGVAVGDYDGDGDEDVYVTNMRNEGNVLYRNDGSAGFTDVTVAAGLHGPSLPNTGFGAEFFDADNDGLLDLFVSNGAVSVVDALRGTPYPYRERNSLYHNQGGGRFVDATRTAGPGLEGADVGRGAAFGDLNGDGRIDIVVSNNNGRTRVLLNETRTPNHYLLVVLEGVRSNRMGLGARVGLLRAGKPTLWRRARTDGSYLSASDSRVHFGLGGDPAIQSLVVEWPGGQRETWDSVQADRVIKLREGTGRAEPIPSPPPR
jgi:hypothetical protein